MGVIKIGYCLEKRDMVRHTFRRMVRSTWFWLYDVAVLVFCVFTILRQPEVPGALAWQAFFFFLLLLLAAPFIFIHSLIGKRYRRLAAYGPIELTFQADGIGMDTKNGTSFLKWPAFTFFERCGDNLILKGDITLFLVLRHYAEEQARGIVQCLAAAPVRNNFTKDDCS